MSDARTLQSNTSILLDAQPTRTKQGALQSDQHSSQERREQDCLWPDVEEHENDERDRGYQREEYREPTAEDHDLQNASRHIRKVP